MDAVERLGHEVLLKVWSEGPEDGLHVHLSAMVAVIAFVDVDDESLVGNKRMKKQNQKNWSVCLLQFRLPSFFWLL